MGCLSERLHTPQVGNTPLHLASERDDAAMVEMLVGATGADVEVQRKVREGG